MARKVKRLPRYVSLEPDAFLSDDDFQLMTAEERGVYCTLIFYLYRNNGRLKFEETKWRKLCNVNDQFDFHPVLSKFRFRRGYIRHKRVTQELARAQVLVDRAVKAANARYLKQCSSNAQASAKQCQVTKRNVSEVSEVIRTSNSKEKARSVSNSLRFVDTLESIIKPRNQSDRTAIKNLNLWLTKKIISKEFNQEIFNRVLDYAKESTKGRNPFAVFFSLLRKELGYTRQGCPQTNTTH